MLLKTTNLLSELPDTKSKSPSPSMSAKVPLSLPALEATDVELQVPEKGVPSFCQTTKSSEASDADDKSKSPSLSKSATINS